MVWKDLGFCQSSPLYCRSWPVALEDDKDNCQAGHGFRLTKGHSWHSPTTILGEDIIIHSNASYPSFLPSFYSQKSNFFNSIVTFSLKVFPAFRLYILNSFSSKILFETQLSWFKVKNTCWFFFCSCSCLEILLFIFFFNLFF